MVWPDESGGQATLDKLVERTKIVIGMPHEQHETMGDLNPDLLRTNIHAYSADPVIYELLSPERARQYGEMNQAINRVCELINN